MLHKVAETNIEYKPSPFDFLPPEVTEEIVVRLDPKTPVALVSKSMCAVFVNVNQWYWRACFMRHFPHLYDEIKNNKNVNWRAEFTAAEKIEYRAKSIVEEKIEYRDFSEVERKAFSFVKEGLVDKLRELALPYEAHFTSDAFDLSLIDWAAKIPNRDMHDYMYAVAEEYFLNIDVRKCDRWGLTLLHQAVIFDRSINMIVYLIANGCDVNALSIVGATPLFAAAVFNRLDQIEALLKNGANIDLTDEEGSSPLCAAVQYGHADSVIKLLQHHANVNFADFNGTTPLYLAAYEGFKNICEILLEHGADVNARDADNETPIYIAAQNGALDTVTILRERGADVNTALNDGYTPLIIAAQEGNLDIVNYLLRNGANVNSVEATGGTAIFFAARKGFIAIVTELLAHDEIDITAACLMNSEELTEFGKEYAEDVQQRIRVYIEEQADPADIRILPDNIARIMGHDEIAGLIQQKREQLQQRQQLAPGG